MSHARHDHLLGTLFELQVLDRVPRIGYALRGVADPESVSEHSFHLVFLVWALVAEEPELDALRVLELALVHDLAEARIGDLPRTAAHYLPPGAKHGAETAALEELLAPLGERAAALHAEYAAASTCEARFVSRCDKLQLLVKATVYEEWGHAGVAELSRDLADLDDGGFASVRRILEELYRRRNAQKPLETTP